MGKPRWHDAGGAFYTYAVSLIRKATVLHPAKLKDLFRLCQCGYGKKDCCLWGMIINPQKPVQPLAGEKEAVYQGSAQVNDYANDSYRHLLVRGCIYKLIIQSSWSGSVLIGGVEKDGVQLTQSPVKPNESTAFRYYFRSGFDADWQLLNN